MNTSTYKMTYLNGLNEIASTIVQVETIGVVADACVEGYACRVNGGGRIKGYSQELDLDSKPKLSDYERSEQTVLDTPEVDQDTTIGNSNVVKVVLTLVKLKDSDAQPNVFITKDGKVK